MNDKYIVIKEIYDNYKNLVKGSFEYKEENGETGPCIIWKVDDNLSAYIDCGCIMTSLGNTIIDYEAFEEGDYQQAADLIKKYDVEFRNNPDYGKKDLKKEKVLLCVTIVVVITIIVLVCMLD